MAVAIPLIAGGIGAWAGSATIGAAAGWAIGSAAGSLLEQKLFGPQIPPHALTDLTVQTSAWGTGLPDIFGVQRVAGNIIWSTDKMLVGGNQGKYGGKGGGGGKGSSKGGKKGTGNQGYYEVAIAFALCEGPVAGIKRIWAGGDLIFDDSAPVYVPSTNPNVPQGGYQQFTTNNQPLISTGGSSLGAWTLYHGTGEQGPDGTIVANGSGNGAGGIPYQQVTLANGFEYTYGAPAFGKLGAACAYRGVAYIVFPSLNIGYGGTIPPLTFEVVGRQTSIQFNQAKVTSGVIAPLPYAQFPGSGHGGIFLVDSTTLAITNGRFLAYCDFDGALRGWADFKNVVAPSGSGITPSQILVDSTGQKLYSVTTDILEMGTRSTSTAVSEAAKIDGAVGYVYALYSYNGVTFATCTRYSSALPSIIATSPTVAGVGVVYSSPYGPPKNGWGFQCQLGSLLFLNATSGGSPLQAFDMNSRTFSSVTIPGGLLNGAGLVAAFTDGTDLYLGDSNQVVYQYTVTGTTLTFVRSFHVQNGAAAKNAYWWANGYLYSTDVSRAYLYKLNSDGSVRTSIGPTPQPFDSVLVTPQGLIFITYNGGGNYSNPTFATADFGDTAVVPVAYPLPAVIEAICQRAGFTSYDITLVPTSIAINLTRHAGTAARDVLKVLCQVYQMDMVDSAGTLRFVPKGQNIVAQLQMSDIGFAADSKSLPPAPYVMTRAPEVDLPRSLTLKYTSALANYNTYAQNFQISAAADYGKDVTVSLPLTLDDATALNAAMLLAVSPHIEKTAYTWTTNFNWLQLEPGDVVQAPWGVTRITQVTLRDTQKQPLIEFQGVIDASYVLNTGNGQAQAVATPTLAATLSPQAALSSASGGIVAATSGPASNQSGVQSRAPLNPGVAYAQYLEPPPLSSKDTTARFLVAPFSTGTQFVGAAIYESTDGGTTYDQIAQQADSAVSGFAANAIPATQPWTWDTTTVLNVYLNAPYMQLSGATDTQVIQGANVAMLGSELIQFANANLMTDAAGNSYYQLSRLLRGRRGTEWAMSTHLGGEAFVLLVANDETTVDYSLSAVNNAYQYKIATVGQDISTVGATSFAPTGIWYKPWAVAQLTAVPNSSAAWVVTFEPRARLNGVWGSGVAPALDPDTTTYSIDIFDQYGSLRRTVSGPLTSPTTFVYTLAMQQADGTSAGAITFNVYQVGTLGRGYVASITT